MTYGVDECRRCGRPIRARRDNPKPGDDKPSKMTQAEWRAAGWLAQPTRAQQHFPPLGCCRDCAEALHRKRWKPGMRLGLSFAGIAAFAALVYWLATIFMP